jgi:uncharacterized protein
MQRPENLLVVFFGMIATGKSYLASAWANHYGLPYYNSDRVRKELAGMTPETEQQEGVDQGIYTPEFSKRTYDALIEHAAHHFQADKQACVVLDGSYQSLHERDLLRKQFAGQVRLVFVHCFCMEKVVQERLKIRASDPDAVSDGNWEIYLAQKQRFQPVTDKEQVIELDTDAPLAELVKRVTAEINS